MQRHRSAPASTTTLQVPGEAPPIIEIAVDACASVEPLEEVKLMLPTHVPGVPGVHPAFALCHQKALVSLSFKKGDDDWITWDVRDGVVELTVVDFGEDAFPARARRWRDGRLVEDVVASFRPDGGRDVTVFEDGAKAKHLSTRKASVSASTAAAVEEWLDQTQFDLDTRSAAREAALEYDTYAVEEYFEPDGTMDFRLEHLSEDQGDGWFLEQMRSDKKADGVLDAWLVTRRHLDGRSSMVFLFDKNDDGRFEKLGRRSGDRQNEYIEIDWPQEEVNVARIAGFLLDAE